MKSNIKLFFLLKNAVIVFVITGICIILHQFAPNVKDQGVKLSIFQKNGMFIPLVIINLLISFGLLTFIFHMIVPKLSGSKIIKALKFGVPFAILWFLGFFEGYLYYGTTLKHDLLHGLLDGISIIGLTLLLSYYSDNKTSCNDYKAGLLNISIVTVSYIIGRYTLYLLLGFESSIYEKPYGLMLWTFLIGLILGIMYDLFKESFSDYSPLKSALIFGTVVFGIDWIMFYSFAPLLQEIPFVDNFSRPVIDIIFVFIGVYVCQLILVPRKEN